MTWRLKNSSLPKIRAAILSLPCRITLPDAMIIHPSALIPPNARPHFPKKFIIMNRSRNRPDQKELRRCLRS